MKGMDFQNFKPCLLIAMPELEDPSFEKSVVLLSDYEDEGALGFVINRPTDITLGQALSLSEGELLKPYQDYTLHYGGPVDPHRIWIVYDGQVYSSDDGADLGGGVALAQEGEILKDESVLLTPNQLRVYHGYAGWGEQQLISEIAASFWLTTDITRELVFETPTEKMWEKAIESIGIDPHKLQGPASDLLN